MHFLRNNKYTVYTIHSQGAPFMVFEHCASNGVIFIQIRALDHNLFVNFGYSGTEKQVFAIYIFCMTFPYFDMLAPTPRCLTQGFDAPFQGDYNAVPWCREKFLGAELLAKK